MSDNGRYEMAPGEVQEYVTEHCGSPTRWDPDATGITCGGLALRGWLVCDVCDGAWIGPGSEPDAEADWRVASSGLSVEAGSVRVRIEGKRPDLAERIARLPDLERALRRIAAGAADAVAIAEEALGR